MIEAKPTLGPRAAALRERLLKDADHQVAASIANCVLNSAIAHTNSHGGEGAPPTLLLAQIMVASGLMTVAGEWWGDIMPSQPRPEFHAVVRDIVANPPPEFETYCLKPGEPG